MLSKRVVADQRYRHAALMMSCMGCFARKLRLVTLELSEHIIHGVLAYDNEGAMFTPVIYNLPRSSVNISMVNRQNFRNNVQKNIAKIHEST